MNRSNKQDLSLIIWVVVLIAIGWGVGSLAKLEISTWYNTLNRSPMTPPNYIFSVVWTILYGVIGACGWIIWRNQSFSKLNALKTLYVTQLILNLSWTPIFFNYHLIGLALVVLGVIDIMVASLIFLAYRKIRTVSLFMITYLLWTLFASYLNFYIWYYN